MIIGHKKQLDFLKKILHSGRIPHAFLFTGPPKIGKKQVAIEFISQIFQKPPFSHPDFIFVEPLNHQIQIGQIRDLIWKISLKPFQGKMKVVLLDSAHLMTKEAQNCFLKTLEEPKGNSLIILITEYLNLLLPTIVSRCQVLRFLPVPNFEIENYLKEKGEKPEIIKKILEFSQGRPGVAIELFENREKLKKLEQLKSSLEKIPQMNIGMRFQYVKNLISFLSLFEILEILENYFRDKLLNSPAKKMSLSILEEIHKFYVLSLTTNIDQRLVLENIFLQI